MLLGQIIGIQAKASLQGMQMCNMMSLPQLVHKLR